VGGGLWGGWVGVGWAGGGLCSVWGGGGVPCGGKHIIVTLFLTLGGALRDWPKVRGAVNPTSEFD